MKINNQTNFVTQVNRIFEERGYAKNDVNGAFREKFVTRAVDLKERGIFDITEDARNIGNFFGKFLRVEPESKGMVPTHEERIDALSKKYAECHDALAKEFKDNEAEYNKRVENLNVAFKRALSGTTLTPIYSSKTPDGTLHAFTEKQEAQRVRFEAEAAKKYEAIQKYNNDVQDVMKNFRVNLQRHTDNFYKNFIRSIKNNDYDTAFQQSMSVLKNDGTTSYNEIGYTDMLNIMDVLSNVPIEFDPNGIPTKMKYESAQESFRGLVSSEHLPHIIRQVISELFDFGIVL
ncbi:hypothetical protein IV487_03075 [Enterococcus saccharolyticus]|uniref:hypothetical protein n=1 Tax=Enterococcus saccharolyticus TaxID=41997 RepID=UPI001E2AC579|nr:hypothetical protein [Enterococcus saccharolyticus]MCD5001449.1 hypothetical protein [Enterococcus saccharolyticus]